MIKLKIMVLLEQETLCQCEVTGQASDFHAFDTLIQSYD